MAARHAPAQLALGQRLVLRSSQLHVRRSAKKPLGQALGNLTGKWRPVPAPWQLTPAAILMIMTIAADSALSLMAIQMHS
jgi:hypothetical protein